MGSIRLDQVQMRSMALLLLLIGCGQAYAEETKPVDAGVDGGCSCTFTDVDGGDSYGTCSSGCVTIGASAFTYKPLGLWLMDNSLAEPILVVHPSSTGGYGELEVTAACNAFFTKHKEAKNKEAVYWHGRYMKMVIEKAVFVQRMDKVLYPNGRLKKP